MEAPPDIRVIEATDLWVVVEKPAGMLSVPGKGEGKQRCVVSRVRELFPQAQGPLIVHRLDMDTSGVLVLGLTPAAQAALSKQFEERRVSKRYVALLDGIVHHADEGVVDAPLRLDVRNRPYQVHDWLHGRGALTRWRVLSLETDRTRVMLEPITGRTHQLRLHAALPRPIGIGHPILGDPLYGSAASAERLLLHAGELKFSDPGSGRGVSFRVPPSF